MRICLISREYPPETGWGGIGTFTYHLCRTLARLGHDVHVVSLSLSGKATNGGGASGEPTVHRVPAGALVGKTSLFNFCLPVTRPMLEETAALWGELLRLHRQTPFDVIECPEHFAEGIFPALMGVAPLVVRLHTPHSKLVKERFHNFEPSFDHSLLTALERVAMLSADALVSPSEDLAAYVADDLNLPLERIAIIRNPVDTTRFNPEGNLAQMTPEAQASSGDAHGGDASSAKATSGQAPSNQGSKASAEVSAAPIKVLFVGRLEERKGIRYLIDAVPRVLEACPQVQFVIIGSDTKTAAGNGSVLADLRSTLAQQGCADAVTFMQHVPLEQMPDYYRAADIYVLPSLYDNAPMTVIEAMSSGKPVVATSAGGAKEYAPDNQCGLIVPPADSQALASALKKLADDSELRGRFGECGRARALEHFSMEKTAQETLKVYQSVQERFERRKVPVLYPRQPEALVDDLRAFMASFDKKLYEMMFTYSWRFRLQHWQTKAGQQPSLYIARALSAPARHFKRLLTRSGKCDR